MSVQIYDRHFAPLPWNVHASRVRADCQWAHRGLVVALPGWWPGSGPVTGSFGVQNDPFRNDLGSQGLHCLIGHGLRGRTYQVAAGSTFFGTAVPLVNVSQTHAPMPTGPSTVILHYRKLDATLRNSVALGVHPNTPANYMGVRLPDTDGTVKFFYGGVVVGTSQLNAAGLTFGDDVWAFAVGARGMEIWQNGFLRASNAGNPTRTNASGGFWGLFGNAGVTSDFAESGCCLVYNRQLELEEIQKLTIDPWTPFRPARRTRYGVAGGGGGGSGARVFVAGFIG